MRTVLHFKQIFVLVISVAGFYAADAQIIQYASPVDSAKKNAADTLKKTLVIPSTLTFGLDMRTRFEWRHGYKSVPTSDTYSAFFINKRTRFNVDYKS